MILQRPGHHAQQAYCSMLGLRFRQNMYSCLFCGEFKPTTIAFIDTTLSFFMSWFFFKGGMMHKDTSTKLIFQKSVKRLLVPFLSFLLLGLLLDGWIMSTKNPDFNCISFIKGEIVTFLANAILWPTAIKPYRRIIECLL